LDSPSLDDLICAPAAVAIEPDNLLAVEAMFGRLPILMGFGLGDEEWDLLRTALVRTGARSRSAIPTLTEKAKDAWCDENAVRTLAAFGPQAQSAMPAKPPTPGARTAATACCCSPLPSTASERI
jgi:hypothetical protein